MKGEHELWWFEYAWSMVSDTVRKCALIGGGVTLLEEVCYGGGGALRSDMYGQV